MRMRHVIEEGYVRPLSTLLLEEIWSLWSGFAEICLQLVDRQLRELPGLRLRSHRRLTARLVEARHAAPVVVGRREQSACARSPTVLSRDR